MNLNSFFQETGGSPFFSHSLHSAAYSAHSLTHTHLFARAHTEFIFLSRSTRTYFPPSPTFSPALPLSLPPLSCSLTLGHLFFSQLLTCCGQKLVFSPQV